jgi:hypothetical protein
MMAAGDDDPPKSPKAIRLPGAIASNLLKTEQDVKRFTKHLKAVNRVRRKVRERRKRQSTSYNLGDTALAWVSWLSAAGCLIVIVLTAFKRRQYRSETEFGPSSLP